jgi:hypothetical protein
VSVKALNDAVAFERGSGGGAGPDLTRATLASSTTDVRGLDG